MAGSGEPERFSACVVGFPFLAIDRLIMNEAIISDDVKVDENGIFGTLTQKRFEWLGGGEMLEVFGHVSPIPCMGDGGDIIRQLW